MSKVERIVDDVLLEIVCDILSGVIEQRKLDIIKYIKRFKPILLQAVQNELEPQKKCSSDSPADADKTETNKIKFTTEIDGKKRKCYGWLKSDAGGLLLGVSENSKNPVAWRLLRINKYGFLNIFREVYCSAIQKDANHKIIIDDWLDPTTKKKFITKDDWRDYFTNESDMMSYNVYRAKAEFYNRIKQGYGRAETAIYISMKKWMAIANGNLVYKPKDICGFCFACVGCFNCVYLKFHPPKYQDKKTNRPCNTTNPDDMIFRFQNPELLAAIEEYDERNKYRIF